jgi:tRNA pseudouridine55 synthase
MTGMQLPELSFVVGCSKGAYIRTIAHDLGAKIGCGAHLNVLRRTAVGKFRIETAATLEELNEASPTALRKKLIPVLQAVPSHAL